VVDFNIKSGSADVLGSGLVISYNRNPIEIESGTRERLLIKFIFTEDDEQEQLINPTSLTKEELELELVNFNNPVGSGTTEPLLLGELDERELYLNFRVYALNGADRTLHYTFYLGEEVDTDER
jgi:hypothetical protein